MIRTKLTTAVFFTGLILASCSSQQEQPCPPEGWVSPEHRIVGIRSIDLYHTDYGNASWTLDENTPIDINGLKIRVEFNFDSTPVSDKRSASFNPLNWLIKSAYACSVYEPIVSNVVGMNLYSNESLGPAFTPGSSLNAAFYAAAENTGYRCLFNRTFTVWRSCVTRSRIHNVTSVHLYS